MAIVMSFFLVTGFRGWQMLIYGISAGVILNIVLAGPLDLFFPPKLEPFRPIGALGDSITTLFQDSNSTDAPHQSEKSND